MDGAMHALHRSCLATSLVRAIRNVFLSLQRARGRMTSQPPPLAWPGYCSAPAGAAVGAPPPPPPNMHRAAGQPMAIPLAKEVVKGITIDFLSPCLREPRDRRPRLPSGDGSHSVSQAPVTEPHHVRV